MNPLRSLAGIAALASFAAGAEPTFVREPDNHYILDCADGCPQVGTEAAIGAPTGIAIDADGNVYFSSQNIVFKLLRDGTLLRFAGTGEPGYSGDGGPALGARLDIPDSYPEFDHDPYDFYTFAGGIAIDGSGNVFIADTYNGRVRRVEPGGRISTVADETGQAIAFGWVQGLAVDAGGNLFASGQYGTVSRRDPVGRVTTLVTANCGDNYLGDGACVPELIALDRAGAVYFGDVYCRVRKWTAGVGTTTVAGYLDRSLDEELQRYCGHGGDGGPATQALLGGLPYGVAVDAYDNLYIADTYNACVRKVDGAGIITTVAGVCGVYGSVTGASTGIQDDGGGNGGPATQARLNMPMGVAIDRDGTLFIADTEHRRVRKVSPDGIITTVAGNGLPLPVIVTKAGESAPLR